MLKKNKISVLVMPSDICNMDCIYCFHNLHHERKGKMSYETLERMFQVIFKSYNDVTFIWHGGEPLTMGSEFYKKVVELQSEIKGVHIENRMQSNLTLLTDEMAEFFCKYNWGIGASFDGVENEKLRGNSNKILLGREKLLQRNKKCGFIMVVSSKNIDTLIESYELFKNLNCNFTINLYLSALDSNNDTLKLQPDYTVQKIKEFFEYWILDKECMIHISYFERMLEYILYRKKSVCKFNSCLGKWMGVRYDGMIVPCNRYFPDKYNYGNVWTIDEASQAFVSEGFQLLLSEAIERREKCKTCDIYSFCNGGCNNVALNENGITNNGGISCYIIKQVYSYVREYVSELINGEITEQINPIVKKMIKEQSYKNVNGHYDVHCDSYHK